MKVQIITSSDKFRGDNDYRDFLVIKVDGETRANFLDGEPEDASLNRDFNDVYSIKGLIVSAYNAGKNGDTLEIEEIESDDFVE